MIPSKTYEICFTRKDCKPDEKYIYQNKSFAMDHFRMFFNQESSELYLKISIIEYDWNTNKSSIVSLLTFVETDESGKIFVKDWRNWKVGRHTIWEFHDFDGYGTCEGIITEKADDHAIMESDGMKLWIDDDSIYMFR